MGKGTATGAWTSTAVCRGEEMARAKGAEPWEVSPAALARQARKGGEPSSPRVSFLAECRVNLPAGSTCPQLLPEVGCPRLAGGVHSRREAYGAQAARSVTCPRRLSGLSCPRAASLMALGPQGQREVSSEGQGRSDRESDPLKAMGTPSGDSLCP